MAGPDFASFPDDPNAQAKGTADDPYAYGGSYSQSGRDPRLEAKYGNRYHPGRVAGEGGQWGIQNTIGKDYVMSGAEREAQNLLAHRGDFQAQMDPAARDAQQYALHALQSQAFHPVSEQQQGQADAAQRNAYANMGPQIQASLSGSQAARGLMSALSMQGAAQAGGMQQGQNITNQGMSQNLGAMAGYGQQAGAMRGQANQLAEFNAQQQGGLTGNVFNTLMEYEKAMRDRENASNANFMQTIGGMVNSGTKFAGAVAGAESAKAANAARRG